ncbi:MAG: efflux RND transporter periplasmic adaptor subunit [Steroidobacteraceae bacterium]
MSIGQMWMSRTRLTMLGAGLVVVGICVWSLSPQRSRSVAATRSGPEAVAVDAAPATRRDVPIYLDGLGTVQAFYTVKVNSRVDGELEKVAFAEGQDVKRGQLLAQIDPRPYKAALDQAVATRAKDEAQLQDAHLDLQRYTILAPQNLASKQQLDTQQALVDQLKAQVEADAAAIESARTELDYTQITSPINGRTGVRLVDPGNIVHATDTTGIVILTQLKPIAAIVTLPEESIDAVAQAMHTGPVSVTALSRGETQSELDRGTIELIDNQIDPTTGTIHLKVIFPNSEERLWPGEFVSARVLVSTARSVLTIPAIALQRGPDGLFVYVIGPDSKVEVRTLKVGYNDEQVAVIEGGLTEGERVVTSNFYRLQPGALVSINRSAKADRPVEAAGSGERRVRGAS